MSNKIYCINRYDTLADKNVKNFSGYEQVIKYSKEFRSFRGRMWLSKLIMKLFDIKKPKNYLTITISKEVLLFLRAFITGNPVFYLYADKDAFLLPLIKRKFNLKRLKIYGTLHWPKEISSEFSFYRFNLAKEFDGIITLSSSISSIPDTKTCVIPHGINLEYWSNEKQLNFENFYLVLGISNRNHQGQIDVIKKIKQIDSAAKFVVLIANPKIYLKYSDIQGVTVINKKIPDEGLRNLYSKSKAVILIQNYCLASNVVLESISMKTPLITNRVGDIQEYLGEDYQLFLGDGNEDELLFKICHHSQFRKEIVNYLSQIRNEYGWKSIAETTLGFIRKTS